MSRLSPKQKKEVAARITAFPTSAFNSHLSPGILTYYRSALGRDYKLLAQMALFVIWYYIGDEEQQVWLAMCKVIHYIIGASRSEPHTNQYYEKTAVLMY